MFRFFLKKNFCDGWDNATSLLLQNVLPILLGTIIFFGLKISIEINAYLPYAVLILGAGALGILSFMNGANSAKIANFDAPSFSTFFSSFKYVWKIGLSFGIMIAVTLILIFNGALYYIRMFFSNGNYVGLLLASALGWFVLISAIALQWFVPLYFLQSDNGFSKCLKKSFIVFFDNAGFSVKVFVLNIILFIVSIVTFSIIPGLSGLSLSCMNALRLRLYKYDWIEKMNAEDPDFINNRDKRAEVPWDELLKEDSETLGPRTLTSFIFPWK